MAPFDSRLPFDPVFWEESDGIVSFSRRRESLGAESVEEIESVSGIVSVMVWALTQIVNKQKVIAKKHRNNNNNPPFITRCRKFRLYLIFTIFLPF